MSRNMAKLASGTVVTTAVVTPLITAVITAAITALVVPAAFAQAPDEEFAGPFASWLDVKRDFGAVGDGRADDTAALQRGLDEIREHKQASVLYVPAGKYRITRTLKTARRAHQDNMVSLVGEDPDRVVLSWEGEKGGTILEWDAWYAKLSRITFDGAGRAGTCLLYGPAFSTCNETSDVVCRDAASGIVFGTPESAGQAENEVLRCRFLRCDAGIQTVNWNSMDIWVWYCLFEDCGRGIHNVMGNWHAWQNVFLRSKVSDVSLVNLMAFSVVNNTSLASKCFLDFSSGHAWGSPTSITGNRVLDPTGDWAMLLDNGGPYLVVDNVMRLGGKTRGVRMTWADQTLAGNAYSREDAVEERGRFRRIEERVVPARDIPDLLPSLPPAPPRRERKVFDLPATASAAELQGAIGEAARLAGQRPVVHLPMGAYKIDRTLVVPRGCDLQLVGDGASEVATRLVWTGPAGGVVLRVEGPSKATLRDFQIQAGAARALLVELPDQEGGHVFADQLNASGPADQQQGRTAALKVSGFEKTALQFRALQGSGNGGAWVEVIGSDPASSADRPPSPAVDGAPSREPSAPLEERWGHNAVAIYTGATGSAAGQYDVRRGGRLVVRGVYHERSSDALSGLHLQGSGMLSIDATRFSYATSEKSPTVAADGFRGIFTLATCILMPVETLETCRFELRGDGSGASFLALGDQFWVQKPGARAETIWMDRTEPRARGGLIGSNINTGNKEVSQRGFEFLDDVGDLASPASSRSGSSESDSSEPDSSKSGSSKPDSGPQAARRAVDDSTILRHLAGLRSARPWVPAATREGLTDLRIHRVIASGGSGATVEFLAAE